MFVDRDSLLLGKAYQVLRSIILHAICRENLEIRKNSMINICLNNYQLLFQHSAIVDPINGIVFLFNYFD